jgi:CheY-like chemotaxis protein
MDGVSFLDTLQRLQQATAFTPPAVVLLTAPERYLGSDRAFGHPLVRGAMTKPLTRDGVNYLIGLAMDGKQAGTAA